MTGERCGVDYAVKEAMIYGGRYADFKGEAKIHIFGKDDKEEEELKLYSIAEANREVRLSREALAVLKIVKEELSKTHYDPDRGRIRQDGSGRYMYPHEKAQRRRGRHSARADRRGVFRRRRAGGGYSIPSRSQEDARYPLVYRQ